ncbi:MAG: DUF2069 domain-containing protein [Steroidobacteraceae bacterium]
MVPRPGEPGAAAAHRWVLATATLLGACVVIAALGSSDWPGNLAFACALLVPLLLPLPGLLRNRRRTHAWATLCVAPYFIYGMTEVIANPAVRGMAGAILFASLALFVALVSYLRLTRPRAGAQRETGS